jgi:hypothetical protein
MKKMTKLGTELELEELSYVQGGQIIADPNFNPYKIHITQKQLEDAGKLIVAAAKEVAHVATTVWHAVTSWF